MRWVLSVPTSLGRLMLGLAFVVPGSHTTLADDVSAFYAGRTMTMVVGYPPSGSPDLYARLVAQHLGNHIPGTPRIIVLNMPGAGSLTAANHLYNVAAKDGSILGAISPSLPLQAKLGLAGAKYEPSRFNWIGRTGGATNVMVVWHTSSIKTIEDARKHEVTFAATGVGSTITLYPQVTNALMKTRFKLVLGYKGSEETFLAVARGEVDGTNAGWETLKAVHSEWLREGKLRMLVQHGLSRSPDLPDLPTSIELISDPKDREVMRVIMSPAEVGKAYFTTPDVPPIRVDALRRAFDRMVKDAGFIQDMMKLKGDIVPMTGEEMQKLIGELDAMPKDLRDRVEAIYNSK